jgi:hypothetical protein
MFHRVQCISDESQFMPAYDYVGWQELHIGTVFPRLGAVASQGAVTLFSKTHILIVICIFVQNGHTATTL